jgi:hypothetical protein
VLSSFFRKASRDWAGFGIISPVPSQSPTFPFRLAALSHADDVRWWLLLIGS